MSKKTHITALGKQFDMASFRTQNEKTRAVGNMNVNARGDVLDSNNNIIDNRNKIVNRMYERVMQSGAKPGRRGTPQAPDVKNEEVKPKIAKDEISKSELQDLDDDVPNPEK